MFIRCRTALMWLLLVALPLQGFAAASMINCGPNHHRMSEASVAALVESHRHAMTAHHLHEVRDGGAAQADTADTGEQGGSSVHHLDKLAKFKCNACAACCMGAAMPTAGLVIASFRPAMTMAVFVSTPHADFLSDGLDRPPRPLLD